jgi:hypothetical protein
MFSCECRRYGDCYSGETYYQLAKEALLHSKYILVISKYTGGYFMKTELKMDFEEAKNVSPRSYSGSVCMFVLNTFRMDARVMRAANALSSAGFAVSVVDIVDKCSQTTEVIHGISVSHVKVANAFIATRFKLWAIIKALLLFIRSTLLVLRTPADFYHAHDATALPTFYISERLLVKSVIFDAH